MTLILASETQNPNISPECKTFNADIHAACPGCACACHPETAEHLGHEDMALQMQNLDTFARLQGFCGDGHFIVHVAARRES